MNQNKTPKPNFKIDEITLVLIVVFIALIVGIYNKQSSVRNNAKFMEAERITEIILDHHKVSFATNGVIDESKLKEIQGMSYENFKKSLSINSDFCIVIEDINGNVILSKGSSRLNNDGIYCME